jgi:hypothetical protein
MKKATKSYKFTAKTNSNGVDIRVNLSFSPNVQEEITWSHQLQKLLKNKSKGVNRKGLILSLAARFKDPETYNIGHQVKEWLRLFDENPQEIVCIFVTSKFIFKLNLISLKKKTISHNINKR